MKKINVKYLSIAKILIGFMLCNIGLHAQEKAIMVLSLANEEKLNLQQQLFFAEQPNYVLDWDKGIPPIDALTSHKLKNFKSTKNNNGYRIEFALKSPKLIYLNHKPIFVKPGDSVNLEYKVIEHTFDTMRDTIVVSGKNDANYAYSILIDPKKLERNPADVTLLFNTKDVNVFNTILTDYYGRISKNQDSILNSNGCDAELIQFIKRQTENNKLFNLFFFEEQLYQSGDAKKIAFSKIVDIEMNAHNYSALDTSYTFGTENLIKRGFKRTTRIKFNNLNTKEDYLAMVSHISNITNPFIKDYYVYFLLMNYHSLDVKYPTDVLQKCKKDIENMKIKTFLTRQSYL